MIFFSECKRQRNYSLTRFRSENVELETVYKVRGVKKKPVGLGALSFLSKSDV